MTKKVSISREEGYDFLMREPDQWEIENGLFTEVPLELWERYQALTAQVEKMQEELAALRPEE
jgi:hypothetical protein